MGVVFFGFVSHSLYLNKEKSEIQQPVKQHTDDSL